LFNLYWLAFILLTGKAWCLLKDNVETKMGTITVADRNKPINVKVFHSVKKTYWSYLDQYNANIQAMSKEAVDKLIAEL